MAGARPLQRAAERLDLGVTADEAGQPAARPPPGGAFAAGPRLVAS